MLLALTLKLAITAAVVVLACRLVERTGPLVGAMIATLPVSAGHSGMLEVSRQLRDQLPAEVGALTSFPVEPGAVEAIAARLSAWLALPENDRARARATLVETVARLWSWEGVARGVLSAAAGELDRLPRPGS